MNRSPTGMVIMLRRVRRMHAAYGWRVGVLQDKGVLRVVKNGDIAWLELGSRARDALAYQGRDGIPARHGPSDRLVFAFEHPTNRTAQQEKGQ